MTAADSTVQPLIRVRDLVTGFGDSVVHDGLDLDVMPGEVLAVVGGSGTGKSVLMKVVLGLLPKRSGEVAVFGLDPARASHGGPGSLMRRWGVLFQDGALFSSLTVMQNIVLPLREYTGLSRHRLESIAALKLAMVGLSADAAHKYPAELSGGMRKRAGLARALAYDPEMLFLDEPTAGLDPIGAAEFDELLLTLWRSLDLTVFMITHDLDSLYRVSSRVAVLGEGKVIASGKVDALVKNAHPWIKSYFNGPRGRNAASTAASLEANVLSNQGN